jgi:hypothetical protein
VGGGARFDSDMIEIGGGNVIEDETRERTGIVVVSPYVVSVCRDKGVGTGEGTLEPTYRIWRACVGVAR